MSFWAVASFSLGARSSEVQEESTYLIENPGHHVGIPKCSGNVMSVACWRPEDEVSPGEICVERDDDTQVWRLGAVSCNEKLLILG